MANRATILLESDETQIKNFQKGMISKMKKLGFDYIIKHNRIGNYFINNKTKEEIACVDFLDNGIMFESKRVEDYTPMIKLFKYFDFTNNRIYSSLEGDYMDAFYVMETLTEILGQDKMEIINDIIGDYYDKSKDNFIIVNIDDEGNAYPEDDSKYIRNEVILLRETFIPVNELLKNDSPIINLNINNVTKSIIGKYTRIEDIKEKERNFFDTNQKILLRLIVDEIKNVSKPINADFSDNITMSCLDKDGFIIESELKELLKNISNYYYSTLIQSVIISSTPIFHIIKK